MILPIAGALTKTVKTAAVADDIVRIFKNILYHYKSHIAEVRIGTEVS